MTFKPHVDQLPLTPLVKITAGNISYLMYAMFGMEKNDPASGEFTNCRHFVW
jgi:hypothetical protein